MKKMAGVENVEVRLNDGRAIIKLKPGNQVRFDDVIKAVRDKAFTPKEASVSVQGELVFVGSKTQIKVSGTNEVYDLLGSAVAELKKSHTKTIYVEGVIPAPKDKAYIRAIELKTIRPTP